MTATTAQSVTVTSSSWTQISAADVQSLQVLEGAAGIIYAAAQPSDTVQVRDMGFYLNRHEFLTNNTGGVSWGRATAMAGSAVIGVTEG